MAAVVLFTVVGLWCVTTDQGPRGPYAADVVAAGQTVDTESVSNTIVWGGGDSLVPAEVTCVVTTRGGGTEAIDVATTPGPRPTAPILRTGSTDEPPATMVVLAEMSPLPGTDLTCSGGGLEAFALGELRLGPPWWVVGVGFFVLAGIAGVWALVTLNLTRGRRT